MTNKILRYILLIVLTIFSYAQVRCQAPASPKFRIHLIIFADSKSDSIKKACQRDRVEIADWLKTVGYCTNAVLVQYNQGNAFTKKSLDSVIRLVNPGPDDVIFFYYTGHGFRFTNQDIDFPYLGFYDLEGVKNQANLKSIHEQFLQKKARLTITMGDLCNAEIPLQIAPEVKGLPNAELYVHLFANAYGNIIMTSCKPFEFSHLSQNNKRSLFTGAFLKVFQTKQNSKPIADWDEIFQLTKANVAEGVALLGQDKNNYQVPIFNASMQYYH